MGSFNFIDSFCLGCREWGGGGGGGGAPPPPARLLFEVGLLLALPIYRVGASRGERPPFSGGEKC